MHTSVIVSDRVKYLSKSSLRHRCKRSSQRNKEANTIAILCNFFIHGYMATLLWADN